MFFQAKCAALSNINYIRIKCTYLTPEICKSYLFLIIRTEGMVRKSGGPGQVLGHSEWLIERNKLQKRGGSGR